MPPQPHPPHRTEPALFWSWFPEQIWRGIPAAPVHVAWHTSWQQPPMSQPCCDTLLRSSDHRGLRLTPNTELSGGPARDPAVTLGSGPLPSRTRRLQSGLVAAPQSTSPAPHVWGARGAGPMPAGRTRGACDLTPAPSSSANEAEAPVQVLELRNRLRGDFAPKAGCGAVLRAFVGTLRRADSRATLAGASQPASPSVQQC